MLSSIASARAPNLIPAVDMPRPRAPFQDRRVMCAFCACVGASRSSSSRSSLCYSIMLLGISLQYSDTLRLKSRHNCLRIAFCCRCCPLHSNDSALTLGHMSALPLRITHDPLWPGLCFHGPVHRDNDTATAVVIVPRASTTFEALALV